ncbi:hypothetical protein Tco_0878124 [Tanacetum coccineum]|uniref:Retrovirus-related Pol polyprotein from transposon TNT 1-94 n=1 Tax=Tanacetum coccineum TaxID=301880 RepID=A0ABQ5BYL7_9ASTR
MPDEWRLSKVITVYKNSSCAYGVVYGEEVDIRIGNQILQQKESSRYLGSLMHRSGRIDEDVTVSSLAGQRKPEVQWTPDERKVANLDQRLKSLIIYVLPDDQINSGINCLNTKSTWDDLILYHERPFDVKESRVMDLKLRYNTFKFKEGETLTQTFTRYKALMNELVNDGIKLSKLEINTGFINELPNKWLAFCQSLRNINHVKESKLASLDFQDSPDDEEDTRSSQEYMNDLKEEYQARALLAKSKRFFKKAKYNKFKAKLALLSSTALAPTSSSVKALMALADEERVSVGKESVNNGEWVNICIKKVHTLLEMEDNDDRKSFLDYLCIDLNYVEEQQNNLLSKYRNLVQELNTCKEQLLVLKQAKLDLFTMQHVNTKILKENKNLRNELKELTSIIETWLNSSNKVNQCISEQIPTQKKKILGIDQLTKNTSSSGPKDLVFVKSSADNSNVSITSGNGPRLSEAEDFILPKHDAADKSLVCSTFLPPLEKLAGAEPLSRPKTIKSILKSKSTFKAEALKGVIINEPSSAPVKGNISTSVSKTNSALAGKLKNVKLEDDPPLAIVMKELNELKLQISKNKSSYSKNKNSQQVNQHYTGQGESSLRFRPSRLAIHFPSSIHCGCNDHQSDDCVYYPICELCGSYDHDTHGHNKIISLRRGIKPRNPQHVTKNCETCCSNVHTIIDYNDIEWFRKRKARQAKKAKTFKTSNTKSSSALRSKTPTKSGFLSETSHHDPICTVYLKGTSSLGLGILNVQVLTKICAWSAKKQQSVAMSSAKAEIAIGRLRELVYFSYIENWTQGIPVWTSFLSIKEICKIRVELEYHFEECYKAVTDRFDWMNPKGHEYPFDPSKPLPLIEDQGRQVVPANYFINNDLGYLKGGSSSRKYTNSTTKTKAAKYHTIEGIEDMVPSLWSAWYDYGYMVGLSFHEKSAALPSSKKVTPRLILRELRLLLFLAQKKLSNLERDVIYDLNVALRMFTRHVVILKLMHSDELYKFSDETLTSVRRVLHDIASSLRMDYLPKRRWSKLDRKRSRIMIKAIDQQLFERRLMRNLEKFVGGRDYGNDLRLLERAI